jgi:hypothetical protein
MRLQRNNQKGTFPGQMTKMFRDCSSERGGQKKGVNKLRLRLSQYIAKNIYFRKIAKSVLPATGHDELKPVRDGEVNVRSGNAFICAR